MLSFLAGCVAMLLLASSFGCSGETPPGGRTAAQPWQGEATALALGVYDYRVAGPVVVWIEGAESCHFTGWPRDGHCVGGTFDPNRPGQIYVAIWQGAALSQTSLAHELRHWQQWKVGGDWSAHDSAFYAIVERANDLLWRNGL